MTAIKLAALCACAVLTACGGATTTSSVPITTAPPTGGATTGNGRLTYSEIADIASDVNAGYNAVGITPKSFVPTSGEAIYSGAVGGTIAATSVAGLMQAEVDFRRNRIGGLMGNFVTADGFDIDGTLSLRNGVLNRTSNSRQVAIFADVGGQLRSAAGENIIVDARLRDSGFKGNDVGFIGGTIAGVATIDGVDEPINMRTQLER